MFFNDLLIDLFLDVHLGVTQRELTTTNTQKIMNIFSSDSNLVGVVKLVHDDC